MRQYWPIAPYPRLTTTVNTYSRQRLSYLNQWTGPLTDIPNMSIPAILKIRKNHHDSSRDGEDLFAVRSAQTSRPLRERERTYKRQHAHAIVNPKPLLDYNARIDPPNKRNQHERHENDIDNQDRRAMRNRIGIVGRRPVRNDCERWDPHGESTLLSHALISLLRFRLSHPAHCFGPSCCLSSRLSAVAIKNGKVCSSQTPNTNPNLRRASEG